MQTGTISQPQGGHVGKGRNAQAPRHRQAVTQGRQDVEGRHWQPGTGKQAQAARHR